MSRYNKCEVNSMPTWSIKGIGGVKFEIRTKEKGHNVPHIHAHYEGKNVSISFDGAVLAGGIKRRKQIEAINWVLNNKELLEKKWKEMH